MPLFASPSAAGLGAGLRWLRASFRGHVGGLAVGTKSWNCSPRFVLPTSLLYLLGSREAWPIGLFVSLEGAAVYWLKWFCCLLAVWKSQDWLSGRWEQVKVPAGTRSGRTLLWEEGSATDESFVQISFMAVWEGKWACRFIINWLRMRICSLECVQRDAGICLRVPEHPNAQIDKWSISDGNINGQFLILSVWTCRGRCYVLIY